MDNYGLEALKFNYYTKNVKFKNLYPQKLMGCFLLTESFSTKMVQNIVIPNIVQMLSVLWLNLIKGKEYQPNRVQISNWYLNYLKI